MRYVLMVLGLVIGLVLGTSAFLPPPDVSADPIDMGEFQIGSDGGSTDKDGEEESDDGGLSADPDAFQIDLGEVGVERTGNRDSGMDRNLWIRRVNTFLFLRHWFGL